MRVDLGLVANARRCKPKRASRSASESTRAHRRTRPGLVRAVPASPAATADPQEVIQLAVGGLVGRWFARRDWAAFVLPLPFACLIFYWNTQAPEPFTRVHEFVHVEQDEAHPLFIVFWAKYLAEHLARGYRGNRYEQAARAVEDDARGTGCPTGPQPSDLTSAGSAPPRSWRRYQMSLGTTESGHPGWTRCARRLRAGRAAVESPSTCTARKDRPAVSRTTSARTGVRRDARLLPPGARVDADARLSRRPRAAGRAGRGALVAARARQPRRPAAGRHGRAVSSIHRSASCWR